jgi:hypothetical protein
MDKKIKKLIEENYGVGKLFEGEEFLDSVKYFLKIHQEFLIIEDASGKTEIPSYQIYSGSVRPENIKNDLSGKILYLELKDNKKIPIVLLSGNPVVGEYMFKRAAV